MKWYWYCILYLNWFNRDRKVFCKLILSNHFFAHDWYINGWIVNQLHNLLNFVNKISMVRILIYYFIKKSIFIWKIAVNIYEFFKKLCSMVLKQKKKTKCWRIIKSQHVSEINAYCSLEKKKYKKNVHTLKHCTCYILIMLKMSLFQFQWIPFMANTDEKPRRRKTNTEENIEYFLHDWKHMFSTI